MTGVLDVLTPDMAESAPEVATLAVRALMLFPADEMLQQRWFRRGLIDLSLARAGFPWLVEEFVADLCAEDQAGRLEDAAFRGLQAGSLIGAETFNAIAFNGKKIDWAQVQGTRELFEDAGIMPAETIRKLIPPHRPVAWLWAEWWRRATVEKYDSGSEIFLPEHLRSFVSNALELRTRGMSRRTHAKSAKDKTIVPADALRLPEAFELWAVAGAIAALSPGAPGSTTSH